MMHFFDCDLGVCGSGQGLPAPEAPEVALGLMDHYAIDQAYVYDRAAMEMGAFDHMRGILDFCRQSMGRLHPTIPVAPPGTGEMPEPDELMDVIMQAGIAGVRVWPEEHALIFNPFYFGPLLERLQARRIPVFVHMSERFPWDYRTGWQDVCEVAVSFPDLPLVVLWSGMRDGRYLLPLLDRCPNIIADLTCVTYQFVEYVVAKWGSRRLVLASHYPHVDPGLRLPWINYSGVDFIARENIAWRTAAQLRENIR